MAKQVQIENQDCSQNREILDGLLNIPTMCRDLYILEDVVEIRDRQIKSLIILKGAIRFEDEPDYYGDLVVGGNLKHGPPSDSLFYEIQIHNVQDFTDRIYCDAVNRFFDNGDLISGYSRSTDEDPLLIAIRRKPVGIMGEPFLYTYTSLEKIQEVLEESVYQEIITQIDSLWE